jgi:hypothetical protein
MNRTWPEYTPEESRSEIVSRGFQSRAARQWRRDSRDAMARRRRENGWTPPVNLGRGVWLRDRVQIEIAPAIE